MKTIRKNKMTVHSMIKIKSWSIMIHFMKLNLNTKFRIRITPSSVSKYFFSLINRIPNYRPQ